MIEIEERRFDVVFQTDASYGVDFEEERDMYVDFDGNTLYNVELREAVAMSVDFREEDSSFDVDFGPGTGGEYHGPYEVTPGLQTQTLSTAGTSMTQNVTVKPIPQNYGLITWDGTKITVS